MTLNEWDEYQTFVYLEDNTSPCDGKGHEVVEEMSNGKFRLWAGHNCPRKLRVTFKWMIGLWNNSMDEYSLGDVLAGRGCQRRMGGEICAFLLPASNPSVSIEFEDDPRGPLFATYWRG